MRKLFHKVIILVISLSLVLPTVTMLTSRNDISIIAEAHSGRTDSSGGHKDNKNKSGLGNYHYHCSGNPAHLHTDNSCPYSADTKEKDTVSAKTTDTPKTEGKKSATSSNKKDTIDSDTIKKVQNKLNDSGYACGKADGKIGKKTNASIKKFQEDNDLAIDGTISKELLLELDIS